ncbi:MAG: phosphohydrolase [Rothia mucilaginosa]|uniref:Phosphohydrolase n=1 Tax=Rothia mucilaginosa TaxID=43675 RepID=A0A930LQF7_9MICC|nr:phosphohydrolase [Rothia mucilaginosa]
MTTTLTPLTPSRLAHMNATANRAYEIATTIFGKSEDRARELYIFGLLHDVGYAFDPADHAHAGGRVLADLGFTTDAVYDHGDPTVGVMDDELLIVNAADMTTSPTGAPMRMEDRLRDIGERYGADSPHLACARAVADRIKRELAKRGLPTSWL